MPNYMFTDKLSTLFSQASFEDMKNNPPYDVVGIALLALKTLKIKGERRQSYVNEPNFRKCCFHIKHMFYSYSSLVPL